MAAAVEQAIHSLNADMPLYNITTLKENMQLGSVFERVAVTFAGSFGLLALLLAAVGIYGVVSYTTRQRTHEIGIRIALGAGKGAHPPRCAPTGMILTVAGPGAWAVAASLILTRFLRTMLFGVGTTDLLTFVTVAIGAVRGGGLRLLSARAARRRHRSDAGPANGVNKELRTEDMQTLLQDLRYAVRQLRKSPGFTLTAIITLALGIGANTAIFTLVQGILLRSLPVADPSRLYRIGDTDNCCVEWRISDENGDFDIFSYDLYRHLKDAAPEFESLAAVQAGQWQWSVRRGNALPTRTARRVRHRQLFFYSRRGFVRRAECSASQTTSRTRRPWWCSAIAPGRTNSAATRPIIGPAIFDSDPPLHRDRHCAARRFLATAFRTARRISGCPSTRSLWAGRQHHPSSSRFRTGFIPWAGCGPAPSIPALQAKLSAALRNWLQTRPVYTEHGGAALIPKQHVMVVPGGGGIQNMQQETGTGLKMLMILSSVVLIIACANIANLVLARSTTRRADIAVRMALGAGRTRVIRQIITESVLLSCIGGLAGLAVAYAGSRTILALAFPDARNLPIEATPSLARAGLCFSGFAGDRGGVRISRPHGCLRTRSPPKCCAASIAPRAIAPRFRSRRWWSFRRRCRWC